MKQKRIISLLAMAICVLLALGNVAYATNSGGTINVIAQCTITNWGLCNSDGSGNLKETQLTVDTEYRVNFTISDQDGMDDITNATVIIWDSATSTVLGTDKENDHYTFFWNSTHGAWTCTGPSSGFYKSGAGSNISEINQYEFYVNFDLSKVAQYSNGGSYIGWKITINATDTNGAHMDAHAECLAFGVAEYSEIFGLSATHSWSNVTVPSTNNPLDTPASYLTFNAIINRVWNATAKSNATTAHVVGLGYTLGIGNVTFYDSDNNASSIPLSTSEAVIGTLDAQQISATESGTACKIYLWVDIPDGLAPGAYIYTLIITVQKDA